MANIALPSSPPPLEMPHSVLFICNFNAVRSAMAEALTKYYCGHHIFTDSCGIRAEEDNANPFAIFVMDEIGLDISRHSPKRFENLMDSSFDLVVTLSPEAHHKAIDLTRTQDCQVEYWPTLDPTAVMGNRENIISAFRQTRDMLTDRIKRRFDVGYSPAI
ncbi:MAG: low molecular weight phosphatase family protein [Alphaproteobacteria bacterium]|nr:MAG: low molecular weight phosphatase family protein [Alphaproteobacteria bacterium]